jgi:diaminopimelate decarboxylase
MASIGTSVHLYYAGKALLTKAVAKWAVEEGLRIDTASAGELATALAAGVPGDALGLHGNNKSDAEIATALENGVGQIIVDSLPEIERLAAAADSTDVVAPVMVRLTTGVHAGGHAYIQTAHEDQKFGLSVTPREDGGDSPAMEALMRILALPSLRLIGLHSHIGSQILDADGFTQAARAVLKVRAELAATTGYLIEEIDLGGGYGIAYLPGQVPMDVSAVARDIAETIKACCDELGTPVPRISVEPGRSIVGPAGVTLYTVGTVKPVTVHGSPVVMDDGAGGADARDDVVHDNAGDDDGAAAADNSTAAAAGNSTFTRLYVSVDGGMSDNIRPALYGANYHAEIVGRLSTAPKVPARVVGKHCESGDIVVHDVLIPSDVRAGDLLATPATGAYGHSMANNYNQLMRPPVVAVSAGSSRTLIRRETLDDLLARDLG